LGRTTTVTNGGTGAVSTTAKGAFTISADGAHEKMLDRYTMPEGRVELPVHGMNDDMGVGVGRGIRSENSVGIGN
jgi:hypothetical protein